MGNKKIIITKETFKYAKNWGGYFAVYDQSDLNDRPEEFMKVELVPVVESKGFPIKVSIYTNSTDQHLQILGTVEYALCRPKAFNPMWFKTLEAIKDIRLSKPVEVTLNAGGEICSAVKVIYVGDTPFTDTGENKNGFLLPKKLVKDFKELSKKEILEIFVIELNNFLERAEEELGIPDKDGNGSPLTLYPSTYFPKADIDVVE